MTLEYILESEQGEFRLFDLAGRPIKFTKLEQGAHKLTIEQSDLSNGIYLFNLIANGKNCGNGKVVIMR